MISTNLFSGILCLILGMIIRTGKANFLIAGYNTMSKEEQANWNESAMSRFIGCLLIVSSILLLVSCIPILLSWGIFTAAVIGGTIYLHVSPRFKRTR